MTSTRPFLSLFLLATISACAGMGGGLGSMQKTTALHQGMTPPQVLSLLGEPARASAMDGQLVWKYSLHEMGKGWVPYYLIFDGRTHQLQRWFPDEEEYARQQQALMEAFSPTPQAAVPAQAEQAPPGRMTPASQASPPPPASRPPPAADPVAECEKRFRFIEDAACECRNICGVFPSFPP